MANIIDDFNTISNIADAFLAVQEEGEISEALRAAKCEACKNLVERMSTFRKLNFDRALVDRAFKRRLGCIKNAKTCQQIKQLLDSPKVTYNGNDFFNAGVELPEEELFMWSIASLSAPLNECACKRFKALFTEVMGVDPDSL